MTEHISIFWKVTLAVLKSKDYRKAGWRQKGVMKLVQQHRKLCWQPDQGQWREKNGEMSRGLRFEGGRIVRFGDGLAREGEWRVQLRVWTKDIIGPFQLKKPDAINLCHYTIRIGGENLQNWHSTMYTSCLHTTVWKEMSVFRKGKWKNFCSDLYWISVHFHSLTAKDGIWLECSAITLNSIFGRTNLIQAPGLRVTHMWNIGEQV